VTPAAPQTPQDAVYAMLDAARTGDTVEYLKHYTGALADSLRQTAAEQGDARFSQYLRDSNQPVKGIAVGGPEVVTEREVKVRVEFVYQEGKGGQIFHLEKQGDRWQIVRLDAAERVKTLVPYGSPAQ